MPKILVTRFSSIGDIVLTTPVVRCLAQQLEGAEVHYLTKQAFASILAPNPYIKKVYTIQKDVDEVIAELRNENYDQIIDLHHNLRSALVKSKLGKPSHTFNKLNARKWLLVNFKWDTMPRVHVVDRYMETVKALGVKNDNKGLDYFIPAQDEVDVSSLIANPGRIRTTRAIINEGGGPGGIRTPFIAFVIGAKHNTKQMPAEKIISICKKISKPVVLLGGKEDAAKGQIICAAAGDHVIDACGRFNLNQSASIVRQAEKVITHDTGLMHIASAFKKTIMSVWGNTVPAFGMYPYLPGEGSELAEVNGLSCRPCSKIGYARCPRGHFKCMNLIDEDAIARFANG